MVQFGNFLSSHRVPGWENYYVGYKKLKHIIREYEAQISSSSDEERERMAVAFSELLDSQVEKTVLFFLQQQGLLASELQNLQEERNAMAEGQSSLSYAQLLESYRHVARGLLQLLQFIEVNATGLRKILKKFDRRTGSSLGKMYISSRTNHPYSQLQQVFRQVGIGAIVGTILRNLEELHKRVLEENSTHLKRTSSFLLFRQQDLSVALAEQEPVVKEILAARAKLDKAVSYSAFLGNVLLLPQPLEGVPLVPEVEEDFHWWSLQINLANTFLYMVNYYIIVPSSDDYAVLLRAPSTLCGVIIGAMPLCAMVSSWVYSSWSNRSYRAPLYISTVILLLGNVAYALALDLDSVWLLLIGRSLEGLGGARAINRRYIADHVPLSKRTSASAAFVSASALGMAAGPFIAGLTSSINFKVLGLTVNYVTFPGWFLAIAWLLYLVALPFLFQEPVHKHDSPLSPTPVEAQAGKAKVRAGEASFHKQGKRDMEEHLLPSTPEDLVLEDGMVAEEVNDEDEGIGASKSVSTWKELKAEMTAPVNTLLFVYFMIKFATEVLVSESSVVSKFLFNWNINQVGIFLACLGITVLPVSAVAGNFVSNIFNDRIVLWWTTMITGVGIVGYLNYSPLLQYSHTQYLLSAMVVFVAANVAEGVNMALLSKVMSPKLARGTFNCGFLSTEAGTFARVVGDALITLAGYVGQKYVLNLTMVPVLLVVVISLFFTHRNYYALY